MQFWVQDLYLFLIVLKWGKFVVISWKGQLWLKAWDRTERGAWLKSHSRYINIMFLKTGLITWITTFSVLLLKRKVGRHPKMQNTPLPRTTKLELKELSLTKKKSIHHKPCTIYMVHLYSVSGVLWCSLLSEDNSKHMAHESGGHWLPIWGEWTYCCKLRNTANCFIETKLPPPQMLHHNAKYFTPTNLDKKV